MDFVVTLAAIVVGVPVLAGSLITITVLLRGWNLKSRELKLREEQLRMEEKLKTDEINTRILQMDDLGISPLEIASLTEEVRRLREEVAQMKQQMSTRY